MACHWKRNLLIKIRDFCKKNRRKFYLSNNVKLALKFNLDGSYLPSFKGLNAQDQAIRAKAKYSGCTVHYVTSKIDSGKIILQKKVKILNKDNTESLSKKILVEEHMIYPKALQKIAKKILEKKS